MAKGLERVAPESKKVKRQTLFVRRFAIDRRRKGSVWFVDEESVEKGKFFVFFGFFRDQYAAY